MRTTTGGSVPRVDLAPVLDLVPALWAEWDGLRFASDGDVLDPTTGQPRPELRLTAGTHRRRGATYLVQVPAAATGRSGGSTSTASTEPIPVAVEVRADDSRRLAARLSDPAGTWSADVTIRRGPVPHVEVTARLDLRAMTDGSHGCAMSAIGSKARVDATIDGSVLTDRRGHLLAGSLGTRRFRGRAEVGVRPGADAWEVTGEVVLRGRGLGRLVMAAIGGPARRAVDEQVATWWADVDASVAQLRTELEELAEEVQAAGGAEAFVRRELWARLRPEEAPEALRPTRSWRPPRRSAGRRSPRTRG